MKEITRIVGVEPRGSYRQWSWWTIRTASGSQYHTMESDLAAAAQLARARNATVELEFLDDYHGHALSDLFALREVSL